MHARVMTTQWLTPAMIRIELGGGDLGAFPVVTDADAYVNLAIRPATAPYAEIFDPADVKARFPQETWPDRRRYTVRDWDAAAARLTLDFVVHEPAGPAARWAAEAEEGDALVFEGPGGGYRPDPGADWHLLVGDESALPAIAAALEQLPAGARAVARLLCNDADHEVPLPTAGDLDLAWVHRAGAPGDGDLLADALRELAFPDGRVHAFVHGEAVEVREIRRHLLAERGLSRQDMSCSPYWRRTMTDEAWRSVKRDFVAEMDADL